MKRSVYRLLQGVNSNDFLNVRRMLAKMFVSVLLILGSAGLTAQEKKSGSSVTPAARDRYADYLKSEPTSIHNPKAIALLQYLNGLKLRNEGVCLTGQAVSANAYPPNELANFQNLVVKLGTQTGHLPAILEYGSTRLSGAQMTPTDRQTQLNEMFARNREGYLIFFTMRPSNPTGVANNDPTNTPGFYINDADQIVNPEGTYYTQYRQSLDYTSGFIRALEDSGIVVIFEPFNEFNGQWNWFGNMTPGNFVKLWKYTHDYFVKEKNFRNLLFHMEFSARITMLENIPVAEYYPGDGYVDILGFDFYHDDPKGTYLPVYNQLISYGKPVAMSEFGPDNREYKKVNDLPSSTMVNFRWDNMIQLDFTKTWYPKICFFMRWQADWAIVNQNNAKSFMEDAWWVNLARYRTESPTSAGPAITRTFELDIFPNPATGIVYLKLPETLHGTLKFEIYSITGNRMMTGWLATEGNPGINLENLPDGVYYCRVSSSRETATGKIILLR
jgi:hypothetical protein